MDIIHTMLMTARPVGSRLTHCPTDALKRHADGFQERPRVLDLGCGTGLWMLEMGRHFGTAEFVGVDMHYLTAKSLHENVIIRAPWDYEGPWALGEGCWDLIHLAQGLGSVSDWPNLYRKILRHLVPGTGWFESVEIDWQPMSDGTSLEGGRYMQWWDALKDTFNVVNRTMEYNERTGEILHAVGFKDIRHFSYRLPCGVWTEDKVDARVGSWWSVVMGPGLEDDGGLGLEGMSLAAMTRYCNWIPDHVRRICTEALKEATDPHVRAYNTLHIWTARAPGPNEP